jgi:hypothetical protein
MEIFAAQLGAVRSGDVPLMEIARDVWGNA